MTVTSPSKPLHLGFAAQLGVVSLVGTALALFGAFGTDASPLPARLLYWTGGLVAAGLLLRPLAIPMRGVCDFFGVSEYWSYLLALPLLCAVLVSLLALTGRVPPAPTQGWLASVYAQCFILGAGIFVLFGAMFALAQTRHSVAANSASRVPDILPHDTRLHERLSPGFGSVLALGVEDHYVHVHGADERREMLLMTLADAIAEVGQARGLRVHRSWWVAYGAVHGARYKDRNRVLVLRSGALVPISRANVAAVRENGWLD